MKIADIMKGISAGTPAGDILKLVTLIAATVLVDRISDVVKNVSTENQLPTINIDFKEE
jgi:hypothetical protein